MAVKKVAPLAPLRSVQFSSAVWTLLGSIFFLRSRHDRVLKVQRKVKRFSAVRRAVSCVPGRPQYACQVLVKVPVTCDMIACRQWSLSCANGWDRHHFHSPALDALPAMGKMGEIKTKINATTPTPQRWTRCLQWEKWGKSKPKSTPPLPLPSVGVTTCF